MHDYIKQILDADHPMNFLTPDAKTGFVLVPKCASTSFRNELALIRAHGDMIFRADRRIAVIRHPFDRLVSAWRYGWPQTLPQHFIEKTLDDPRWDAHVAPYHKRVGIATEIYRLEEIGGWWKTLNLEGTQIPKKVPRHNATDSSYVPSTFLPFLSRILDVYADDMAIWLKSGGSVPLESL